MAPAADAVCMERIRIWELQRACRIATCEFVMERRGVLILLKCPEECFAAEAADFHTALGVANGFRQSLLDQGWTTPQGVLSHSRISGTIRSTGSNSGRKCAGDDAGFEASEAIIEST